MTEIETMERVMMAVRMGQVRVAVVGGAPPRYNVVFMLGSQDVTKIAQRLHEIRPDCLLLEIDWPTHTLRLQPGADAAWAEWRERQHADNSQ